MGTRGFLGFVVDGTEKIAYNHFDSYPEGLGEAVRGWLTAVDWDNAAARARALRVVAPESEPTDDDIALLGRYLDRNVGGQRERPDWYQLLRETQGSPEAILDAGVIEDASGFPCDSLFAEWGYVVDFDAGVFEVYQGFQHEAHTSGRFAARTYGTTASATAAGQPRSRTAIETLAMTTGDERSAEYHPVALVASWPFADVPDKAEFLAKVEGDSMTDQTSITQTTDAEPEPDVAVPEGRCPRCSSPAPHLHPSVQYEGEVQICTDAFHGGQSGGGKAAEPDRPPWPELQLHERVTLTIDDAIVTDPLTSDGRVGFRIGPFGAIGHGIYLDLPANHPQVKVERAGPADGVPQPGELWADQLAEVYLATAAAWLVPSEGAGFARPWEAVHTGPTGPIRRLMTADDIARYR